MARVGTATMVGTCAGAGLEARARRVTLVSCLLAAAIFAAMVSELPLRKDRSELFIHMSKELSLRHSAISTRQPGLRVHGRLCDAVFRISGMGTGDGSAGCQPVEGCYRIVRRTAALSCRRFHGYWSVNAGRRFRLPAAKSTRFDAFRLKS